MCSERRSFAAPAEPRFHFSESAVAAVNGFTPCAPTATARVAETRHTARSDCTVTEGCTTYQLRPSCVPTITPPSPTAQPSVVSLNETPFNCDVVGFARVHDAPASVVL